MDKRGELRVAHQIRFFVHVHECNEDPDMVGVSVECEAIDFSTRGMQFRTNSQLISRSLVKITIGIGDPFAMYELIGEIRWVRPIDDDFSMGVLLHEESSTDYEKWGAAFNATFG
ncbi:MAG: hypothetical protein ACI82A_001715 [Candidatus Azotimanducaceae bacterium]|jgi:hypothetical protein